MQKRTKHIDVKYHFVRERVEDETVELQYCISGIMEADFLTKALSKAKLEQHASSNLDGLQPDIGESQFNLSGGVEARQSQAQTD